MGISNPSTHLHTRRDEQALHVHKDGLFFFYREAELDFSRFLDYVLSCACLATDDDYMIRIPHKYDQGCG